MIHRYQKNGLNFVLDVNSGAVHLLDDICLLYTSGWADEIRTLHVRTNGDTPRDATQARKFGAEGIGLCRTEHMFFEPERIKAVREMIVSDTVCLLYTSRCV